MGTRLLRPALGVLVICLFPRAGAGQECKLSHQLEQLMPAADASDFGADYRRAMIYIRADCPRRALPLLESAKDKLPSGLEWFRVSVDDALQMARIRDEIDRGLLAQAQEHFIKLLDQSATGRRTAIDLLGPDLQLETNDKAWARLEGQITRCAATYSGEFWCKEAAFKRKARTVGLAENLRSIESILSGALPSGDEIEFQIIRADLLVKSGRTSEAAVLLKDLEPDVLKKLLDERALLSYFSLCVQVWQQRATTSRGDAETDALKRYQYGLDLLRSGR